MSRNPLRLAWGLWALLLVMPLVLLAALPILALPKLESRRAAAGAACRAYFGLCGLPVRRLGLERLPAGGLRHRREPRELHRRPAAVRAPAAALRLRHQEGGLAPAARRHPAAPARPPLRRAEQPPRGRQRRAPDPARTRAGRRRRVLPGRHVQPGARRRALSRRGLRARRAHGRRRSRRSPSAARAKCWVSGRAWPRWGRIEVEVLAPLPARTGSGDAATELRDAARERIAAGAGEPLL